MGRPTGEAVLREAQRFLKQKDPSVNRAQAEKVLDSVLGAMERQEFRPHIEYSTLPLGAEDHGENTKWDAVRALAKAEAIVGNGRAIPVLADLIVNGRSARTRMETILTVVELGNRPEIVSALVSVLSDWEKDTYMSRPDFVDSPCVCEAAACALVEIGDPAGIHQMVRHAVFFNKRLGYLMPWWFWSTRADLIRAAGPMAADPLVEIVKGDLPEPPHWVQRKRDDLQEEFMLDGQSVAAELLGQIAGTDATGVLTAALDPERPIPGVIKALEQVRAPHAVAKLAAIIEGQGRMQYAAGLAIYPIVKNAKNLSADDRTDLGEQLIGLLDSRNAKVRALGAEQLGVMQYAPATTALERALSDPESKVRRAAKKAAKKIAA